MHMQEGEIAMHPNTATKSWIEKTPGVCGGEACIRRTRHTVAGLVEWRRLGMTDEHILQAHPDLTLDDLKAAWDYFDQHPHEVEQAIKENEEA